MSSGSSGTDTVTQSSEPWSQAQPYLRDIFGQAQSLYNQGQEYYPGSTVVPFHGDTEAGLQGLRQQFQQAPIGLGESANAMLGAATGQSTNAYAPALEQAAGQQTTAGTGLINQSAGANPFAGNIQQAANQKNTAGTDVLQQMASSNVNPYLDEVFGKAAEGVKDNANAIFAKAGRYGSNAHQGTMSDSIGDLAANMYGNAYETDANRRFASAEALGAREAGDINRQMSGAGQLAGLGESQFGRQAGAGSTLASMQQNDLSRQLGALGQLGGYGESNLNRQLQASSLMPNLNTYAQANNRGLMEIGGYREGQAQNELQDSMNRWNFGQTGGWDQLSRYNSVVQPMAALGGSSTQTQPGQSAMGGALQGAAGGAMAGASFGPWGAAIGGGLGALGSIFG